MHQRNPVYIVGDVTTIVTLKHGYRIILDTLDYKRLTALLHKPYWQVYRTRVNTFYARVAHELPDGTHRTDYLHRLILGVQAGVEVDHKDGDGLNNRRENLRPATRLQNARNRQQRNGRVLPKGVQKSHNSEHGYSATISNKNLGSYSTAQHAAWAYDTAARQMWGEFSALNYPEIQMSADDILYLRRRHQESIEIRKRCRGYDSREDLIGQVFGRLTVLRLSTRVQNSSPATWWWCRCRCGTECEVRAYTLKNGNTRSCGCLRREEAAQRCRARAGARINSTEKVA